MRKILPLGISCLLILTGCQSSQKKDRAEIQQMEERLQQSLNFEDARQLIDRYENYATTYPKSDELNSKYLYRAAGLAYRMNRYSMAVELLERAIKDDYAGSNTPNNALLLAAIYKEKLGNEMLATTIFQAAAAAFPENAELQGKVDSTQLPAETRFQEIQAQIFDSSQDRIDFRLANDFINSASLYALLLPGQETSAEWLFMAAETARSIRAFSKALELYDLLPLRFPDSPKAPEALFLQAFTLDNDLARYEEAGELYQAFLNKYPDNAFAKDARFLLENLGKDEEEIIRSFEEKNREEKNTGE